MSLFSKLIQALRTWQRRRGAAKVAHRADVAMEHLDHRQLLAVTFTGNVINDFPESQVPGVVVLKDSPANIKPGIPLTLREQIKVSGFQINNIRVSYTATDDVLSIGLESPPNQRQNNKRVIAGDADNNGNAGTVAPDVKAIDQAFQDFGNLAGTEYMAAFLDFNKDGVADVLAGYSQNALSPKSYQVSDAIVNPNDPQALPEFGQELPLNTGAWFLVNSADTPDFEFSINNFSKLYKDKTGQDLSNTSSFNLGAYAGSQDDDGISEQFFPGQTVNVPEIVVPPKECEVSPPILINPHSRLHINTFHDTKIRVNLFGTSGFDVTQIIPESVRLNGAAPVFALIQPINSDPFKDALFVFNGKDVDLPRGPVFPELTGTLQDGTTFRTSNRAYNQPTFFTAPKQATSPVPAFRPPGSAAYHHADSIMSTGAAAIRDVSSNTGQTAAAAFANRRLDSAFSPRARTTLGSLLNNSTPGADNVVRAQAQNQNQVQPRKTLADFQLKSRQSAASPTVGDQAGQVARNDGEIAPVGAR